MFKYYPNSKIIIIRDKMSKSEIENLFKYAYTKDDKIFQDYLAKAEPEIPVLFVNNKYFFTF